MDHVCVVKWWSCWAFPCINFLFYICAGNNILHERYVIYIFFKCNGWLLVWIILSLWATSFFLVWFFICFCLFLICLNSFSFLYVFCVFLFLISLSFVFGPISFFSLLFSFYSNTCAAMFFCRWRRRCNRCSRILLWWICTWSSSCNCYQNQ
jgi:hypothetical protein